MVKVFFIIITMRAPVELSTIGYTTVGRRVGKD